MDVLKPIYKTKYIFYTKAGKILVFNEGRKYYNYYNFPEVKKENSIVIYDGLINYLSNGKEMILCESTYLRKRKACINNKLIDAKEEINVKFYSCLREITEKDLEYIVNFANENDVNFDLIDINELVERDKAINTSKRRALEFLKVRMSYDGRI